MVGGTVLRTLLPFCKQYTSALMANQRPKEWKQMKEKNGFSFSFSYDDEEKKVELLHRDFLVAIITTRASIESCFWVPLATKCLSFFIMSDHKQYRTMQQCNSNGFFGSNIFFLFVFLVVEWHFKSNDYNAAIQFKIWLRL